MALPSCPNGPFGPSESNVEEFDSAPGADEIVEFRGEAVDVSD